MLERARHFVGNVLDERAAQRDVEQLLAAANAQHRLVGGERALGDGELEGGALVLGGDALVPRRRTEERGIDVEGAARHHQSGDEAEISGGRFRLVRQKDRQAARRDDGAAIVLAQRIPGMGLGIAAGRFAIEGEADDGLCHADGMLGRAARPGKGRRRKFERLGCRARRRNSARPGDL